MIHLVATLCENGGTPKVMVRLENTFVLLEVPFLDSEANHTKVSKVQLEFWHVAMAKLHNLLTWLAIDQTNVIHRFVVVHNEEGVVQLKWALACWYQPLSVLLNFGVQPLMLGKATVDGLGLIDADLDPCPYHILTTMGGSEKTLGLTKQEIVI
jgi:hypothetical protein